MQSPFDFDDSDPEDQDSRHGPFVSNDDYELNNWDRPASRRRPPPPHTSTQHSVPQISHTPSHTLPPQPSDDFNFANVSSLSQTHLLNPPAAYHRSTSRSSTSSSLKDYANYSYDFDDYLPKDDEGYQLHTEESPINSSPNGSSAFVSPNSSSSPPNTAPYNNPYQSFNGYASSNNIFQPFQRDSDEPEIFNQDSFVEEEKKVQPSTVANTENVAGTEKVKLLNGEYYSFDYPVPKLLLDKIPFQGAKDLTEFSYLRYHAITADPKDYNPGNPFARNYIENYPLRQKWYPIQRETELMVVCTMYNEDEVLLARTLKGVFKNIKHMYNLPDKGDGSQVFGRSAWKKIVVVVVADGRNKLNDKAKSLLTLLGCYQEGIIQEKVNDKDVKAHLFEYTTSFGIGKFDYSARDNTSAHCRVPLVTDQTIPVQLMFLLKEKNAQKINSHRWALNFLCPNLRPKVVCLIDVGTEPGPDSIYKLWEAFKDPQVAGVCGEIRAMLGRHASANDEISLFGKLGLWIVCKLSDLWACVRNPLVAAQNFEYKMSNVLDKPTESFYGFVTVLPGAFSAYRYEALQGDPLEAYFHGEDMKTDTEKPAGVLESNMYLAEDRILCYQLVSKPHSSFLLRYVHDSFAVTDVPGSVDEFMAQRRRWLNGSFFAALYSLIHFYRILGCSHGFGRKLLLVLEMVYQFISIILSWFALATYFLIFRILTLQVINTSIGYNVGNILAVVFLWIYIAAAALTFIISFGNKPNENKRLYQLAFALFAIIGIYMMFCVIVLTITAVQNIMSSIAGQTDVTAITYFKNSTFRNLTISLASTYVLYILSSLLFFDTFHLIACTLQYLLLNPAYVNVLSIYAFCNIDDISWGTKGALKTENSGSKKAANVVAGSDDKELLLSEALSDPDELYLKAQKELQSSGDGSKKNDTSNIKQSLTNYAKGRTYAVLFWLASNFALLVVVLRTGGLDDYISIHDQTETPGVVGTTTPAGTTTATLRKRNYDEKTASIFMTVILWIVAAMALFRFVGCVFYRIDFFVRRRKHRRSGVYY